MRIFKHNIITEIKKEELAEEVQKAINGGYTVQSISPTYFKETEESEPIFTGYELEVWIDQ